MAKALVERSLPFAIYGLARQGLLRPGCKGISSWDTGGEMDIACQWRADGGIRLVLDYSVDDVNISEWVSIESEPCRVGAPVRYVMLCPQCFRRVRVLYKPPRDERFACRLCHDLCYRSQLRSRKYRRIRRMLNARY